MVAQHCLCTSATELNIKTENSTVCILPQKEKDRHKKCSVAKSLRNNLVSKLLPPPGSSSFWCPGSGLSLHQFGEWVSQPSRCYLPDPYHLPCRHWLYYESYLVENSVGTVDRPFVKSLVQDISTDTSEDLLFSLKRSQVKTSSCPLAGSGPVLISESSIQYWCPLCLTLPDSIQ